MSITEDESKQIDRELISRGNSAEMMTSSHDYASLHLVDREHGARTVCGLPVREATMSAPIHILDCENCWRIISSDRRTGGPQTGGGK